MYFGEVVEWFKALVLKTSEVQASVGSNPTLSAISFFMAESQIQKPRYIFLRDPAGLSCHKRKPARRSVGDTVGKKDVPGLLKF